MRWLSFLLFALLFAGLARAQGDCDGVPIQSVTVNITWTGDEPGCSSCSQQDSVFFNTTRCTNESNWNAGFNQFTASLPPNSVVVQMDATAFGWPDCDQSSCTLGFLLEKTYLIVFDPPEMANPDDCIFCTTKFESNSPPPPDCSGITGFNYTGINEVRIFTSYDTLCVSAAQITINYIQTVPEVTSVFPTSIPISTEEIITITGSGLLPTAGLSCLLNGLVYPVTYIDTKTASCTVPPMALSSNENFNLSVSNSTAVLFSTQILFYESPTISSLTPDTGSSYGLNYVYLIGSSFFDGDGMVCKFGKNKAVSAQYINSTCVSCTNPIDSSCTSQSVNVSFSPNGVDYISVPQSFLFTGCETPTVTPSPPPPPPFPSQTPVPTPSPSMSPRPSSTNNTFDLPKNFWYYLAVAFLLVLIFIVAVASVFYVVRKNKRRSGGLFGPNDDSNSYGSTSSSSGNGNGKGNGNGNGSSSGSSLTSLLLKDPNTVQMSELTNWREIEKGSFGVIYQATWRGTVIAVKKLPSKMIEREFHREAALMKSLRHPNVLQYLGTAVSKTEICILMEYMAQGSLYRLLHDPSSSFGLEKIRSICIDTARGMNYLHQQEPPIIHRDLKSHNLLVDEHWRVKVCDFGLSRFYQANATMTACGTPSWTAPEVLRNERYTTKADVYGFGIVVWEMLARRDPFPGMPPFQIVFAVGTQGLRPSIDDDWDPRWVRLLQECWAEDPKKRPSFEQILNILESMQD